MVIEDEHEEPGLFPRFQKRSQHSITVQWTYIRDDSKYFVQVINFLHVIYTSITLPSYSGQSFSACYIHKYYPPIMFKSFILPLLYKYYPPDFRYVLVIHSLPAICINITLPLCSNHPISACCIHKYITLPLC